ncbi:nucleoside/nucleotide kinase family protein [Saccharothrix syringae]|uniref:hypothetical protein n=1 Tax=Saccharothrix syringae TaxID=103733 RepID=UPI000525C8D3|nr:hypothetical protein [Saccharothrix syringae]
MIRWIDGPRGVGKSTVGWEVHRRLCATTRGAYVDLAQITFADPPLTPEQRARNLRAVWRGYREAGAEHLVVVGDHALLLPGATLWWLHASHDHLVERLLGRGRGEGVSLAGDDLPGLPEAGLRALAVVRPAPAGARVVDTGGRTPAEVASEILSA